ncbi:hypothetical protein [Candidatus Electronema sp. PJ]|uniref:hypothetical protein n=1 Tax=Candidatus Electronema sp. PJ TaxID=3401572 RepID=UPI003AA88B23
MVYAVILLPYFLHHPELRLLSCSLTKELYLARKEFCRLGKELYSVEEESG